MNGFVLPEGQLCRDVPRVASLKILENKVLKIIHVGPKIYGPHSDLPLRENVDSSFHFSNEHTQ